MDSMSGGEHQGTPMTRSMNRRSARYSGWSNGPLTFSRFWSLPPHCLCGSGWRTGSTGRRLWWYLPCRSCWVRIWAGRAPGCWPRRFPWPAPAIVCYHRFAACGSNPPPSSGIDVLSRWAWPRPRAWGTSEVGN